MAARSMQKRSFDPDPMQTLKREIVGCSASYNIDTHVFSITHFPPESKDENMMQLIQMHY